MIHVRLPAGRLGASDRAEAVSNAYQRRLEGYYPNPPGIGFAGLYGNVSNGGKVWNGVFFPAPEPPGLVSGQFLFVLSDDGQSFYGSWTARDAEGVYPGGAPQPWWGRRFG